MVQNRLKEDAVPTIQVPVFTRDVLDCQILGATEEVWIPASVVGMDVESGSSQVSNSIGGSQLERKRKRLILEHNYGSSKSPRYWMNKYRKFSDKYMKLNRKLQTSRMKVHRLKKNVVSLKSVVDSLRKERLVSEPCEEMLERTFSGVPLEVMKRIVSHKHKKLSRKSYPPELRAFALTLQFYSTKAYKYVRENFNLALPHPGVIRRWYQSIDGEPGFTSEALSALRARVQKMKEDGNGEVICSLMIDEMAIKKHVEWTGSKFSGYVDMGTTVDDDTNPVATEALVFMVVALNSNWKIPVGYFLIAGLSGTERANLVKQCLMKLHDVGVRVVSLTCDGPSCHLSMMKELGASLDPADLNPSFVHPSDETLLVFIIFDVCHMLKLVRNVLGDWGVIVDELGQHIKWQYFVELQKLQEKEGLHLGNKLRASHINFQGQKMKVNLAAQTVSSSVATAMEFCNDVLHLPQFIGCEATVTFVRTFDRLFDLLNSRNPFGKGYKAPLKPSNLNFWMPFVDEAYSYILNLRDLKGVLMTHSRRKTPFIGFLCAIASVKCLYNSLVGGNLLKYLLTYKLSQDHLELYFAAVRSSFGCNNNPTARQFVAAYKRLLVRHEIKAVGGNCIPVDDTTILHVTSDLITKRDGQLDILDMSVVRQYDLNLDIPTDVEHDYSSLYNYGHLSAYKEYVIPYISGFVVKMVRKRIKCPVCLSALTLQSDDIFDNFMFISFKNKGGLIKPSDSVVRICESTELFIQRILNCNDGALPQHSNNFVSTLTLSVVTELTEKNIFLDLNDHMLESTVQSNHVYTLMKCITQCFIKIRMHALARSYTEKITGKKVRKQLSKLVLFKHQ